MTSLNLPEPLPAMAPDSTPDLPTSVLQDSRPTPTHCGITVPSLYGWLLPALLPPLAAGAALFGWRALAAAGVVLASTVAGVMVWRLIGQRGRGMQFAHALYLGGLMALLVPAELAREAAPQLGLPDPGWPLLVAAGFLLAISYWLLGGVGARLHPVALSMLLLLIPFQGNMTPRAVLIRPHLLFGDILVSTPGLTEAAIDPHLTLFAEPGQPPAVRSEPAAVRLTNFTQAKISPDGSWVSLDTLVRDRMPPLEDLIVGGAPAPLGLGSVAAVLLGGLILLYRGGADWRIPLVILVTAMAGFLCLRLPVVVTGSGPVWRWLAWREQGVTWETLATFAFYQIAAGPLVFMAFFLATSGASTPMSRRGRVIYAALLGAAAAAAQLYLSVSAGPLLALLVVSLFSPVIDRCTRPKPVLA